MFHALGCLRIRPRARTLLTSLCAMMLCIGLAGCSFLKPAHSTTRYYVLTPVAATPSGPGSLAVGLGQVKLPAYLFNTSLAVRKGTNEIEYLDSSIWAERLDTGFQRVLAANLATVLTTDRIQLSTWQRDDVTAEVYVAIEQFDVDATGRGVLVARWRVVSPGGDKMLKAETSRLSRQAHHRTPVSQAPSPHLANSSPTSAANWRKPSRRRRRSGQRPVPTDRRNKAKPIHNDPA